MNFKDPVTTFAYNLISLHHDIMWYMIIKLTLVYWSLYKILKELKEFLWNIFLFLKIYFININYNKLEIALLQAYVFTVLVCIYLSDTEKLGAH